MFLTNEIVLAVSAFLVASFLFLKVTRVIKGSWLMVGSLVLSFWVVILVSGHFVLLASAREISTDWSPDGTRRVVIYKLPAPRALFFSGPGSLADSPGFARAYDADGSCFGEVKLPLIQCGQTSWYDHAVEIGVETLRWK